jgi:hypothetical protein
VPEWRRPAKATPPPTIRSSAAQNRARFPLSKADCAALGVRSRDRIIALHEGEIAAHAAMLDTIS